jgi:hypothetical protein
MAHHLERLVDAVHPELKFTRISGEHSMEAVVILIFNG